MMKLLVLLVLLWSIVSCNEKDKREPEDATVPRANTYYVDKQGKCADRTPCFTTIQEALWASYSIAYPNGTNISTIPSELSDQVIVMPGTYSSEDPDYPAILLAASSSLDYSPTEQWRVDIIAEQGPAETIIGGSHCVEVFDYVRATIGGFTFSGCKSNDDAVVNDHYAMFIAAYKRTSLVVENNIFDVNETKEGAIRISPFFVNYGNLDIRITRDLSPDLVPQQSRDNSYYATFDAYAMGVI